MTHHATLMTSLLKGTDPISHMLALPSVHTMAARFP